MAGRPALRALAERVGIVAEYLDQSGRERRSTSDPTRERLLAALGFDASSEESARRELERWDARAAPGPAPPASRCVSAGDRGAPRAFGVVANLYTLRSETNWGAGNLDDLATLAGIAGAWGADFLGLNPLHAIRNRAPEISPYGPVSRLFRNPLYIAIERIPELTHSPEARSLLGSKNLVAERERLRSGSRVEYERVTTIARPVLAALHRTFTERAASAPARAAAYEGYRRAHDPLLTDFATWCALDEHFAALGRAGGWPAWPEDYHDPRSSTVGRFAADHAEAVDFHRWLQFVLDEQLEAAAGAAGAAGLRIGLYQDLAIGTIGGGADSWMHRGQFVSGVALGAPPDAYSRDGQNWGLPPLNPIALRDDGFGYWRALIRAALEHAGALRIDHALGLFRQFWIPDGLPGSEGAYIRFPTAEMLHILAEESRRARAIVVGEDLGTVPPEVAPTLEEWGIYRSAVLYFERSDDVGYAPASAYPAHALASVNTHDMPTLTGFWNGHDIELRERVGLIDAAEAREERDRRDRERHELIDRLEREGVLGATPGGVGSRELVGAVHRFLCASRADLVGLSLDDLVGEPEPVNLPGVGLDRFPSWQRRLRVALDTVARDERVRAAVGCERGRPERRAER